MTFQNKYNTVFLSILLLSACGGGSSGGSSDKKSGEQNQLQDTTAPTAALLSPVLSRATTNREVVITGSASDSESSIRMVSVNNVQAASENNFTSWTVNLPLTQDIDKLTLEVEDSAGNSKTLDYDIHLTKLSSLFSEPSTLTYNADQHKLIILDRLEKSLFLADSDTPNLTLLPQSILADETTTLNSPQKIIYDSRNREIIVLDQRNTRPASQALMSIRSHDQQGKILKEGLTNIIDITIDNTISKIYYLSSTPGSRNGGTLSSYNISNGLTNIISDDSNNGPKFESPSTLNIFGQLAYYIEKASDQLIVVDLSSGDRSVVSPKTTDSLTLIPAKSMIINHLGTQAWAADTKNKQIISIDLNTGSRKILSNHQIGDGLNFESPESLIYDQTNNRLLVGDTKLNIVLSVNTETGNRDYFISNRYGHGPLFEQPAAIEVISDELAYVLDSKTKSLTQVNIINGNRRLISSGDNTLQGLSLKSPSDLSIDIDNNTAWVVDRELAAIIEIDLTNGDRRSISTQSSDGASDYKIPVSIDNDGGRLYVSDIYHDKIQKTNSYTGKTTRTLHKELSDGTHIKKSLSIDIDTTNQIIYGIDQTLKAVYQLDLASGKSKIISSPSIGSGINFDSPISIQVDESHNAYIADSNLNAIIHVNLTNGNRTVLSNQAVGSGPIFKALSAISYKNSVQKIYAIDKEEKAVFSIDISTGNRSIESR